MKIPTKLSRHDHPLTPSSGFAFRCYWCKSGGYIRNGYHCTECDLWFHKDCGNDIFPYEIFHTSHPEHSLLCGLKLEGVLYHCSMCNFSVCLSCASIPPPIDVEHLKTHEHKLTLMARKISFTCNACGMQGGRSPYFCLECDFMIHRSCIGLPRVININRHEHRLSHTQQLGFGEWVCGVCLQNVNRFYGAYSCSVCIGYVVHSRCATENDVWDGIELEGSHEETKDMTPFKKVGKNLINHFSHNHYLKFSKDGTTQSDSENIRCEACMLPVYSKPVYSCVQCGFILHEICANLPSKKQHMFHNQPFTLHVGDVDSPKVLPCSACGESFNGFRYESEHVVLDVRCILISELLSHENHEHPLHYNKTYIGKCDACHTFINSGGFSCNSCPYNLDFLCASLPKTVKHTCDEHPLSLSGKNFPNGKYWCDICEEEMDPNIWFYTCNDCEVALHVQCALGDFSRLKPGRVIELQKKKFIVIPNNHSSRPICVLCGLRCTAPFILKSSGEMIFCSQRCVPILYIFKQNERTYAQALLAARSIHGNGP